MFSHPFDESFPVSLSLGLHSTNPHLLLYILAFPPLKQVFLRILKPNPKAKLILFSLTPIICVLFPGVPAAWTAGLDQMHNLQSK